MEHKNILISALSAGVGLGIGLASRQRVSKWGQNNNNNTNSITPQNMEQEMLRLVVDGRNTNVTFNNFPYYLSEQTRVLLTSAGYVHLKHAEVSKYTRNLAPASRTILLSGSAELYQQVLAKALAHYFEAKLLLLDLTDFSLKAFKRSTSESTLDRLSDLFGSFSIFPQREDSKGTDWEAEGSCNPPKLRRNVSASANMSSLASQSNPTNSAPLKRTTIWSFDEKLLIQTLYKVLGYVSKTYPVVLYLRDVDKMLNRSQRIYNLFQKMLKQISGPILVLGSRVLDSGDDCKEVDEKLTSLFPYNIEIRPPDDESQLVSWKTKFEEDVKVIKAQDNRNHIMEVLAANDLYCNDLDSICVADTMVLSNCIQEIVVSAISDHLMNSKDPEYRNGKLQRDDGAVEKPEVKSENPAPAIKAEADTVIPANEIGVTFSDIGALDDTKESLQELVMLPLRRPDLFAGGLLSPCRGILLFGPPGTGKTMLAKAIANEAGASFINVSMSTITSKWFGEDEKNVRALFTLAAKVSPTIIFVDEVDSMLGQRTRVGEHEAMRKIKNEFMSHWDGLMTNKGERILVLAATNRPFDLDEAIIRRFERRIMVGLPSVENREKILRTLLEKDKVDKGLDFKELATMTEGYSGSDLKNLCTTAAYRPVRELIRQEILKDQKKRQKGAEEQINNVEDVVQGERSTVRDTKEEFKQERVINLRPLNMQDFKEAKKQVAASYAAEGAGMSELKQWNELYGEGGSRKQEQLSYFL
ncbi:unnamed protein product [Lupinus luteus]|uniref:AAA+ ATPase domain-containing protein n=1 Tax=Lupinus luteus TaxID=3873 RepID=A0AAV1WPY8_LUPLU